MKDKITMTIMETPKVVYQKRAITRNQEKVLLEDLDKIEREFFRTLGKHDGEPAAVKRARAVMDAFHRSRDERLGKLRAKQWGMKQAARRAVLFSPSVDEALAVVARYKDAMEKLK